MKIAVATCIVARRKNTTKQALRSGAVVRIEKIVKIF